MRQYRHQCQTLFGLFNSFLLSPPIRCISRSLSIYISRSLCLAFSPCPLATLISPLPISPRRETETAQAHHWSLTHFAMKRNSSVKDTVAGSENFHQRRRRRRRRFGIWVCLIWWMWVCAGGGRRCCCGSGCRWSLLQHSGWVVVGDDDDDDDSDKDWDEVIYYFNL